MTELLKKQVKKKTHAQKKVTTQTQQNQQAQNKISLEYFTLPLSPAKVYTPNTCSMKTGKFMTKLHNGKIKIILLDQTIGLSAVLHG